MVVDVQHVARIGLRQRAVADEGRNLWAVVDLLVRELHDDRMGG